MKKTVHKSYRFKIFPTREQEILLAKHFGCCRFVFNRFLEQRQQAYQTEKESLNYYDNAKALTALKKEEEYVWLKDTNSQSLQASLKDLENSYQRFFKKQNKFPRFKSRYEPQSFTIPQNVSVEDGKLIIPKFREGIKIKLHREYEGRICFATLSKSATGTYHISLACETQHQAYEKTHKAVGIDTGIKDLAVLSNGITYSNQKSLHKNLKKLQYEGRQLSKKQKGSGSRNKQRLKLAKAHQKTAAIRNDYLQKVTTEIVKNHDVILIEDLAVKNLMKNHCLARAMSDVSLGTFYRMLEYKSDWNDRELIKIDRFFPSSKTCSTCGWIKQDLELKHRKWQCEYCDEIHDRDYNAARNILMQGLRKRSGLGTNSDEKQKWVEALSLDKSVKPEAQPS